MRFGIVGSQRTYTTATVKYIQEDSFSCSVLELVLDRPSIHITLFNLNFKLESGELSHSL